MKEIKQGQLIALTSGEYSDYCLNDHVKALKDFDPAKEFEWFKTAGNYKEEHDCTWGWESRFIAWLIRRGLIEPDDTVIELYMSDYLGEASVSIEEKEEWDTLIPKKENS